MIIIPIACNVAENAVAVTAALKNDVNLTMAITFGSTMQVSLFVAPLLVFLGLLFGQTLTLFFSLPEVAVLTLAVLLAASISNDGDSNWLEGAMLLAVWAIAACGFFFL